MSRGSEEKNGGSRQEFHRDIRTLILVSLCFLCLSMAVHVLSPPHEGDSSEFAAIARNIFEHGRSEEYIIKDFSRGDYNIPHPTTSRNTFFPLLILPFYIIFGKSVLAMSVPGAIGYFLAVIATYVVGYGIFGRRTAFWSAFLVLFGLPVSTVFLIHEPCEPEMFLMAFYLLCIFFHARKRYALAGAVLGLAYMAKQTSLALGFSFFVFTLLFDRTKGGLRGLAVLALSAVVVASPLLIRNYMAFGSPVYSEQSYMLPKVYSQYYDRIKSGEILTIAYDYRLHTEQEPARLTCAEKAGRIASLVLFNAKTMLFGSDSGPGRSHGIIEGLDFILFLLLVAGMYFSLRDRRVTTASFTILFHCSFFLIWMFSFRYILPVVPLMFLVSLYAAGRLFPGYPKLAGQLAVFIFATEFVFFAAAVSTGSISERWQGNYTQLTRLCEWGGDVAGPDDVIMALPYSSVNFLCDRAVVEFPSGDAGAVADVAERFGVKYVYHAGGWRGDRFPLLYGMKLVASNGRLEFFSLNPAELSSDKNDYMKELDMFRCFYGDRFNVEVFSPFFRNIRKFAAGIITGRGAGKAGGARFVRAAAACLIAAAVYLGLLLLFIRSGISTRRRAAVFVLLVVLSFALEMASYSGYEKFREDKPSVSRIQLSLFIGNILNKTDVTISVGTNAKTDFIENILRDHFGGRFDAVSDRLKITGDLVIDEKFDTSNFDLVVYIEAPPEDIFTDADSVARNNRLINEYLDGLDKMSRMKAFAGMTPVAINGGMIFYRVPGAKTEPDEAGRPAGAG